MIENSVSNRFKSISMSIKEESLAIAILDKKLGELALGFSKIAWGWLRSAFVFTGIGSIFAIVWLVSAKDKKAIVITTVTHWFVIVLFITLIIQFGWLGAAVLACFFVVYYKVVLPSQELNLTNAIHACKTRLASFIEERDSLFRFSVMPEIHSRSMINEDMVVSDILGECLTRVEISNLLNEAVAQGELDVVDIEKRLFRSKLNSGLIDKIELDIA